MRAVHPSLVALQCTLHACAGGALASIGRYLHHSPAIEEATDRTELFSSKGFSMTTSTNVRHLHRPPPVNRLGTQTNLPAHHKAFYDKVVA